MQHPDAPTCSAPQPSAVAIVTIVPTNYRNLGRPEATVGTLYLGGLVGSPVQSLKEHCKTTVSAIKIEQNSY